jgi:glycosyltransferase involved in cell wall biosynthesis
LGKVKIVADCHTKALRRKAKGRINNIFWPIKRYSFSKVNLSVISNAGMIGDIEELHSDYILLPDKIPEINFVKDVDKTQSYCVYVSSFAVDEPVDEIFEVANILQNNLDIYWTGKITESKIKDKSIPTNLKLTGYLNFGDFYNLIGNSDCILALTTEKDCLQSGAYEALSVEVPMVISDSTALRDYFQDSALYTKHNPNDIAEKILYAIENQKKLIQEEIKLKELRNDEFKTLIKKLQNY